MNAKNTSLGNFAVVLCTFERQISGMMMVECLYVGEKTNDTTCFVLLSTFQAKLFANNVTPLLEGSGPPKGRLIPTTGLV